LLTNKKKIYLILLITMLPHILMLLFLIVMLYIHVDIQGMIGRFRFLFIYILLACRNYDFSANYLGILGLAFIPYIIFTIQAIKNESFRAAFISAGIIVAGYVMPLFSIYDFVSTFDLGPDLSSMMEVSFRTTQDFLSDKSLPYIAPQEKWDSCKQLIDCIGKEDAKYHNLDEDIKDFVKSPDTIKMIADGNRQIGYQYTYILESDKRTVPNTFLSIRMNYSGDGCIGVFYKNRKIEGSGFNVPIDWMPYFPKYYDKAEKAYR